MTAHMRICFGLPLFGLLISMTAQAANPVPISAVAYAPDGTLLAAGGYGKVSLVDPTSGQVLGQVPEQTLQVTALAFDPTGRWLAIASGEPGKNGIIRLYPRSPNGLPTTKPGQTLEGHSDLVHALSFSPDGRQLASGSYDRTIRLYQVGSGELLQTLTDHSDAVYDVAFQPQGSLLASVAADRAVKVWDPATGKRLYTLGDATDWLYAVAWSPDGKELAAGGVDKSIRVWKVDAHGGRLVRSVFAHEGAVTQLFYAANGKRLFSSGEDRMVKTWDARKLVEQSVVPAQPEVILSLALRPDAKQFAVGRFDGELLLLDPGNGKPMSEAIVPADIEVVQEQEPTESPRRAMPIVLGNTISGVIERAGDVDYFTFNAKAGREVGIQVRTKPMGSELNPWIEVIDGAGNRMHTSTDGLLGFTCPADGQYAVSIRDRDYLGAADRRYHLEVGDLPIITHIDPLGAPRGQETVVRLFGVHLGDATHVSLKVPADAKPGSRLPLPLPPMGRGRRPMGKAEVVIGEFPEVHDWQKHASQPLTAPVTVNGRLTAPGASQTWQFQAREGERLVLEVHADRLGSPLDSVIEVQDIAGEVLERATLRCVAQTFSTLRDVGSKRGGIRLEYWNELAQDDFLYVNGELMRIAALPKNPDDDCQFVQVRGQRRAYLGTTPKQHPLGTPLYKVEIHPPGKRFPPNGMPVFRLPYRNDDGGHDTGKDSRLFFDPPSDGVYQVRIADSRGQGGSDYGYRLTLRTPQPDFRLSLNPRQPSVWQGNGLPITVTADRIDGYEGPINLEWHNLPPGFHAPATWIEAEQTSTQVSLWTDADAKSPPKKHPGLELRGKATIDDKEVVRSARSQTPKVIPPGDLVTSTVHDSITIRPGQETRMTVRVERRNNFKGRIPLAVEGLPHGVRVLDIGLNGILILPKETAREVVLYSEPWVQPMQRPLVVFARREGKNTRHAAKPVRLTVEP